MSHKTLFFLIAWAMLGLLLCITPMLAGDGSRIGTAAGTQVLVPVGARDLAMGGANIANTVGVDAIYWNPAGFSGMTNNAVGLFSTMTIFNDINVNYAALGLKAGGFGNIGVSLKFFDFGEIPETTVQDPDGASGRTFSPTFVTAGLTYARRLTDVIQVGFTGKLIHESGPRIGGTAFAFDAGIQYHQMGGINGLSLGLVVKNVGTNMEYSGSALTENIQTAGGQADYFNRLASSDQLPALVELGMGYQRQINEDNRFILTGNFQNNNFGNDAWLFGAEYSYGDLVALRGGYRFLQNTDVEDQEYSFTLGVGLHVKLGKTDFNFDYAYRDSRYFDGNNLFSFTLGF